jgi:hypothetical protein
VLPPCPNAVLWAFKQVLGLSVPLLFSSGLTCEGGPCQLNTGHGEWKPSELLQTHVLRQTHFLPSEGKISPIFREPLATGQSVRQVRSSLVSQAAEFQLGTFHADRLTKQKFVVDLLCRLEYDFPNPSQSSFWIGRGDCVTKFPNLEILLGSFEPFVDILGLNSKQFQTSFMSKLEIGRAEATCTWQKKWDFARVAALLSSENQKFFA